MPSNSADTAQTCSSILWHMKYWWHFVTFQILKLHHKAFKALSLHGCFYNCNYPLLWGSLMQQNSFSKNGNFRCFGYCSIILQCCINQTHLKQDLIQLKKKKKWPVKEWQHSDSYSASAESQIFGKERDRKHKVGNRTEFSAVAYKLPWKTQVGQTYNTLQIMQPSAGRSRASSKAPGGSSGHTQRGWEKFGLSCATELSGSSPGFRHFSENSFFRSHKPFWLPTHHQRREEIFQDSSN